MSRKTAISSLVLALLSFGCQGTPGSDKFAAAQQIVDSVAAGYPSLVRLTLHAKPAGSSAMQAVASSVAGKRGQPSDAEDMRAVDSGEETVLEEGENLDVTVPLADAAGKRIAAAGVTLKRNGRSREELVGDAHAIAGKLGDAVRAAKQPLW